MKGGWPAGLDDEIADAGVQAREDDGPQARRPVRPAARQRALRRQVLDAGHDGHRPQPRPQRRERQGPRRTSPTTSASRTTATAASSRCTAASCWASTASHFEHPLEKAKAKARRQDRRRADRQGAEGAVQAVPGRRQEGHRQAVPAEAARAAARCGRGRVRQLERCSRHRLPRARAHQPRPRHRGQRADDGVRQPRRELAAPASASPATPPPARTSRYGDFLINAQGEDVVAGIRNTEDLDHMKLHFPEIHKELLDIFARLERALPRHVRHRVHHRAGQALDAADPRRQAHRRCRAEDGRRHDQGHGQGRRHVEDLQAGSHHARRRRAPRPGAAPAVRRQGQGARQGPRRVAGRRGRQGVLHRRRRRRRRRAWRDGHPGPQRDQPRRRARHDGQPGHPHRPRRPGQPRRRRRPRLGHAGHRRRRVGQDRRQDVPRRRHRRATKATSSASTAPPARSCWAR